MSIEEMVDDLRKLSGDFHQAHFEKMKILARASLLNVSVIGLDDQGVFYREDCPDIRFDYQNYEGPAMLLWWPDCTDYLYAIVQTGFYFSYPVKVENVCGKLNVLFSYVDRGAIDLYDIRPEYLRGLEHRVRNEPIDCGYRNLYKGEF